MYRGILNNFGVEYLIEAKKRLVLVSAPSALHESFFIRNIYIYYFEFHHGHMPVIWFTRGICPMADPQHWVRKTKDFADTYDDKKCHKFVWIAFNDTTTLLQLNTRTHLFKAIKIFVILYTINLQKFIYDVKSIIFLDGLAQCQTKFGTKIIKRSKIYV